MDIHSALQANASANLDARVREDVDVPADPAKDRMTLFVELYARSYPRLQFYIMALVPSTNDANDILQDASLVMWRKFDTFQLDSNFLAWACTIVKFQAMKYRQTQARSVRLLDEAVLEKISEEAIRQNAPSSLSLQALEHCIGKLRGDDRALIHRRYQPGVTVQQMADESGRSPNAISQTLARIRRMLLLCVQHRILHEGSE